MSVPMRCVPRLLLLVLTWRTAVCAIQLGLDEVRSAPTLRDVDTCGEIPNNIKYPNLKCFCDADCHLFGECCVDRAINKSIPKEDSKSNNEKTDLFSNDTSTKKSDDSADIRGEIQESGAVLGIPRERWGCQNFEVENTVVLPVKQARMVMRCPRDALTKISDACMVANRTSPNFHYTMDIPVLSSVSGVWYRNVYCAVCNGDAKHLAPVSYSFGCDQNITKKTVLEEGKYTENLRWILGPTTCQLKVKLLPTSTTGFLRPCGKTCAKKKIILIEDCPPSWTDMDIARKCRGYAFYTKLRKNDTILPVQSSANDISTVLSQVYKNPHCAMCNGVSTEDLMPWLNTCSDSLFKTRVMPSYAIILDFMGNGGEDEAYRLCQPPNGVWDVIEETCIEIISSVRSGRMLNETCPKIKLMKSEFQTLDNGSLEYTGNNSRYIGQIFNSFEILENETAIVCDLNRVDEEEDIIILSQGYLTEFCLSISVICLFLHIIIYCALPKLRNLPGKNLLALSCALLLAQFGFLIGITPKFEVSKAVCVGIASLEYFCFLAAFFWMNIMSVDIWRTFSGSMLRGSGGLKTYRKYSGYAWGIPAFLVLLALTVDLTSDDGAVKPWFGKEGVCWFGSPGGLGLFFALPVFILLVMDSGLFIFTVYKIWHTKLQGSSYIQNKAKTELIQTSSRNSSDTKTSLKIRGSSAGMCGRKDQVRFYLYLKLFTIMGLTWIFGFIAALGNQPILWYPFIIFNGLQGAFIFVMFDMKRKIGHMLWDKYVTGHGYQPPGFLMTSSSSATRTMTSSSKSRSRDSGTATDKNYSSATTGTLSVSSNTHLNSPGT